MNCVERVWSLTRVKCVSVLPHFCLGLFSHFAPTSPKILSLFRSDEAPAGMNGLTFRVNQAVCDVQHANKEKGAYRVYVRAGVSIRARAVMSGQKEEKRAAGETQ